jgi:gliding motility-associated lipoprotein GldH
LTSKCRILSEFRFGRLEIPHCVREDNTTRYKLRAVEMKRASHASFQPLSFTSQRRCHPERSEGSTCAKTKLRYHYFLIRDIQRRCHPERSEGSTCAKTKLRYHYFLIRDIHGLIHHHRSASDINLLSSAILSERNSRIQVQSMIMIRVLSAWKTSYISVRSIKSNMKKYSFAAFIFLCLTMLNSCDDGKTIYKHYEKFGDNLEWYKSDVRKFEIDISENKHPYQFVFSLRVASGYMFDKAYVRITETDPAGNKVSYDVGVPVRDEKGNFYGEKGFDIIDIEYVLDEKKEFPVFGKYNYEIQHMMDNVDPLIFTMEIGLTVKDIKK